MLKFELKKAVVPNKWRNYYLGLVAIGTTLATIYTLLVPAAGNRDLADLNLPQQIELGSGKLVATPNYSGSFDFSQPQPSRSEITEEEREREIIKTDLKYQYFQSNSKIDLELGYLVNTRGDVDSYLQQYTDISSKAIENKKIVHIDTVGYHALFQDRDRAYLSSCISPRSPSNVTQQQFSSYRYQNDLNLQIGWQWLQGKASIRDRRCLWVHLSTPLNLDSQTAYKTLETAWREIYSWLLPNFPAL